VQLDWQILSIVLPFAVLILVIVLGEVLFRRRRRHAPAAEPMAEEPSGLVSQSTESPVAESEEDLLGRLQTDLEQTSALYSSGKISKEEFSLRTRRTEEELATFRARTPPVEQPKTRFCIHCRGEIPLEAVYCDRCGRYLGTAAE